MGGMRKKLRNNRLVFTAVTTESCEYYRVICFSLGRRGHSYCSERKRQLCSSVFVQNMHSRASGTRQIFHLQYHLSCIYMRFFTVEAEGTQNITRCADAIDALVTTSRENRLIE